jgi:hypothetical protein
VPTVTVSLAAAVSSDTAVSLSSSNPTAASVPAVVTVPGGQTSAVAPVTTSGVASDTTVTITATLGTVSRTAAINIQAGVLVGLTFNPSSVPSQGEPVGTVALSAFAPPGGATVRLESTNTDVLRVPSSVTIPAGTAVATFTAATSTIRSPTNVTVSAVYGSTSLQFSVVVGPPTLEAIFTVTSDSRGSDACAAQGGMMDCILNGRASSGFPSRWRWTMRHSDKSLSWTGSEGETRPPFECSFLEGATLSNDSFDLRIELVVTTGTDSSAINSKTIRFYPNGACGY